MPGQSVRKQSLGCWCISSPSLWLCSGFFSSSFWLVASAAAGLASSLCSSLRTSGGGALASGSLALGASSSSALAAGGASSSGGVPGSSFASSSSAAAGASAAGSAAGASAAGATPFSACRSFSFLPPLFCAGIVSTAPILRFPASQNRANAAPNGRVGRCAPRVCAARAQRRRAMRRALPFPAPADDIVAVTVPSDSECGTARRAQSSATRRQVQLRLVRTRAGKRGANAAGRRRAVLPNGHTASVPKERYKIRILPHASRMSSCGRRGLHRYYTRARSAHPPPAASTHATRSMASSSRSLLFSSAAGHHDAWHAFSCAGMQSAAMCVGDAAQRKQSSHRVVRTPHSRHAPPRCWRWRRRARCPQPPRRDSARAGRAAAAARRAQRLLPRPHRLRPRHAAPAAQRASCLDPTSAGAGGRSRNQRLRCRCGAPLPLSLPAPLTLHTPAG